MKRTTFTPPARQHKIIAGLVMLLLAAVTLFSPKMVKADGVGIGDVKSYEELVKASADSSLDTIYVHPSENFGWPSTPVTLNIHAKMWPQSPWTIPANVTIRTSTGFGTYEPGTYEPENVTLAGNMIFENSNNNNGGADIGNMTVASGGSLTIEDSCHNVNMNNLTVKKGASLNVNSFLFVGTGNVLKLEAGAIVNAPGMWSIRMNGGILQSNGAKINGAISVDKAWDGTTETIKNSIEGTLTMDEFYAFVDVTLPSGTTLTVNRAVDFHSSFIDVLNPSLTVAKGAVLNLKNYNHLRSGKLIVKNGGKVNAENLQLCNEMMDGKVKGGAAVVLESGAFLNMERFLNLDSKTSITGSGTIKFAGAKIIEGEDKIAKTIKIISNGSGSSSGSGSELKKDTTLTLTNDKKQKTKYKVTATGSARALEYVSTELTGAVTIPASLKLDGFTYPVKSIAAKAFSKNTKVTSVSVPSSVTTIGSEAFAGATRLAKVTGMSGVSTIGQKAFYNCTALTQVGSKSGAVILSKVKVINANAFRSCKKIKTVNLTGNYLTTIGTNAFYGCTSLTSVAASSTKLTTIGTNAFYKAAKLKSITLKTTALKSVGTKAIYGIYSKAVIKVPSSRVTAYKKLFTSAKGFKSSMKITK